MSSLQVDSISSMGGGHVDGAGLVVQFVSSTTSLRQTFSSTSNITCTVLRIPSFTPKFSNSKLIIELNGYFAKSPAASYAQQGFGVMLMVGGVAIGNNTGSTESFLRVTPPANAGSTLNYSRFVKKLVIDAGSTASKDIEFSVAVNTISSGGIVDLNLDGNGGAESILTVMELAT
jgi:hypothetical protein